jgi:pimeloyl-ACP methyl ester carboxylesterase
MQHSRLWCVYALLALATDGLALAVAGVLWAHGATWPAVLAPLAVDAGWRWVFAAFGFRNARRLRPAALARAYPQSLAQRLRTQSRETLALWRMFSLLMPWPGAVRRSGNGLPILFVHGLICNAGVWRPLARALARRTGAPLRAISLAPAFGRIDDYAAQLHAAVETLCREAGAAQVLLVGHSMGGLVIRKYLHTHGAARVRRIVTLGSPHHGVYVGRTLARLGPNLREMKYGSAWLSALNAAEAQNCPVPILSVWSPHDNIIPPQDTARLCYPNARERVLPGEGHDTLLFSRAVWDLIGEEWRAASQDTGA